MAQIEDLRTKGITTGRRWRSDYTDANGKRHRQRFATKREAEAHLSEIMDTMNKGSYVDPRRAQSLTVGRLWDQYRERLETHGASGRGATSAKTLYTYSRHMENYILPRWGDTRLSSVRHDDVSDWLTHLPSKTTGKRAGTETRKAVGTLLVRMLDYAVTQGIVARNPAKDAGGHTPFIPGQREARRTRRQHVYLSPAELVALADQCGDWRDLVLFVGTCGLRWGEVTALTVGDVELDHQDGPMVHVHRAYKEVAGQGLVLGETKSGERREVPVPGSVVPLLHERLAGRSAGALVFPDSDGHPLRNSNFGRRVLAPARARVAELDPGMARVADVVFHDLRHTAVSIAISQGSNILAVQRIAGHATATMTLDTYAGLFRDDLFDSARRVDAVLSDALADAAVSGAQADTLEVV